MAVENKYTDTLVAAGKLQKAALVSGAREIVMVATLEVAAADNDGSVYKIFKGIDSSLIPVDIKVNNDAITSGTDYDIGLYDTDTGAVVDKDCFADGLDLSSAHVAGSEISGLTAPAIENLVKTLAELMVANSIISSVAVAKPRYDIAVTANTVGSAAGTITVRAKFVQG